jgi:LacI family transcriptional regulator
VTDVSSGRPTLADVAARAGVSLKTASRALNGEYGVAAETARRVLEASRELGFRPNHLARSLASGRQSAAVGLVVSSVSDHFMAAITGTVEGILAPRDLQLVTASHGDDPARQRRLVRTLVERRVDALLLVPAPGDATYLQPEIEHGLVVVAVDRPLEGVEVDTVTVDNREGARTAVARLIAAGHRRIAMLGWDRRVWTVEERHAGYLAAFADAGLTVDPDLVLLDYALADDPEAALEALLSGPDPATAVMSAQHSAARSALRVAQRLGRDVDIAVFDEIHDADLLVRPPLVVVSGAERLGAAATTLLLERLDGAAGPSRRVVLAPEYVDAGAPDAHARFQAVEPTPLRPFGGSGNGKGAPAADRTAAEVTS